MLHINKISYYSPESGDIKQFLKFDRVRDEQYDKLLLPFGFLINIGLYLK